MSGAGPALVEPAYLTAIPIIVRIAATYFAVVAAALAADLTIVHGATFRTWPGFAAQALAALALGGVVIRGESRLVHDEGRSDLARMLVLAALVAVGVLAGGFFPDRLGYSRRAPEPFVRTWLAILPAAIAAYVIVRTSSPRPLSPSAQRIGPQETQLAGTAREAATKALAQLTACEEALSGFDRRGALDGPPTKADIDRVWATLDGYEAHLRALPIGDPVSNELQDAGVAYVDATTLTGLALGAQAAMEYSPENAARFIEDVAARRGVTSGDAAHVATIARTAAQAHRARAAELLQATRFRESGPAT